MVSQGALQGNVKAQTALAYRYGQGRGVEKNYTEALHWFLLAADQGDARAQAGLGFVYSLGEGVPEDDAQAVTWFRKAADQGERIAQYQMGLAYSAGRGVLQDRMLAADWFRRSAEQEYGPAQWYLGAMYQDGDGVSQNYVEAAKWYRKAADQGDAIAQEALGWLYYDGQGVHKDDVQAIAWFQKAADQGNADAKKTLELIEKRIAVAAGELRITVIKNSSQPFTTHSYGASTTDCNLSDSNAHCNTNSSDVTWTHVENTMLVEGSDRKRYTISCTASFRWSKCAGLKVGDSFSASVGKDGMTVFYRDGKGKPRLHLYTIVASEQIIPSTSTETPQDQSAVASKPGKLSVTSTPSGADVSVDGSFVGNTPSVLSLAPGKHLFVISAKGFHEWTRELLVNGGSEISISATLEKND
jgi:TPR repeat protein